MQRIGIALKDMSVKRHPVHSPGKVKLNFLQNELEFCPSGRDAGSLVADRFPKPLQLIYIQLLDVVSRHVVIVKIVSQQEIAVLRDL